MVIGYIVEILDDLVVVRMHAEDDDGTIGDAILDVEPGSEIAPMPSCGSTASARSVSINRMTDLPTHCSECGQPLGGILGVASVATGYAR